LDRGPSPSFSQASTLCSDDEVDTTGSIGARFEEKAESKKRSFSRRIRKSKDWWSCSNWRRDVVRYKKALMLKRSKIESNGVFSTQKIPAGACLVEYMGERIPSKLADERERNYVSRGIVHDYMFRIDDDITIDATCKSTHISKYINHSCEPNACSKVVSQDGHPRVVIMALRDIDPNEEITYDYAFPIEDDPENRVKCLCGAPSCRGFIN
jgi:histone-lysine N-methyltransferase SETD1